MKVKVWCEQPNIKVRYEEEYVSVWINGVLYSYDWEDMQDFWPMGDLLEALGLKFEEESWEDD